MVSKASLASGRTNFSLEGTLTHINCILDGCGHPRAALALRQECKPAEPQLCCRAIPAGAQLSSPVTTAHSRAPLPCSTSILLLPLGGLKSFSNNKNPSHFSFSKLSFFFTPACEKASPPSPFPPVQRFKVHCGAASIGLFFFLCKKY